MRYALLLVVCPFVAGCVTQSQRSSSGGDASLDAVVSAPDEGTTDSGEPADAAGSDSGAALEPVCDPGQECVLGCEIGLCDADGQCADREIIECEEKDGNTCTVPTCVVIAGPGAEDAEGTCTELAIDDGEPPWASSECFDGAVCLAGEMVVDDALPTELAMECEALGETLDPLGCVDAWVCVGGAEKCRPVVVPDGTQCWPTDGEAAAGPTCAGHSCMEGECTPDEALDETCGDGDYPPACGQACQTCTELTCHWIEDPVIGMAKRIRYCRPGAVPGASCTEDACTLNESCVLGASADGPLGKETLGACGAGEPKTAEVCLQEAGKPALPCLLAGTTCDSAAGGCQLNQAVSDQWCWPPEGLCWEKDETFCTHLDSGDAWNAESGCHIAWVDLDCDDGNDCTVGQCKPQLSDFICDFTLLSGPLCDDGDACSVGESCESGQCVGAVPKCDDGDPCNGLETCDEGVCAGGDAPDCEDGNACTVDSCDAVQGCSNAADVGADCDDDNLCTTVSQCDAAAVCQPLLLIDCADGNPCTEDFCDPESAGGCQNPTAPNGTPCPGGQCVKGDCVSDQGDPENGKYFMTASPSSADCGLLISCTFLEFYIDLEFTGATVVGNTTSPVVVTYTGTRDGSDFEMTGSYFISQFGIGENHTETWDCTFTGPGIFEGTIQDQFSIDFIGSGTVTWNVTGTKQ